MPRMAGGKRIQTARQQDVHKFHTGRKKQPLWFKFLWEIKPATKRPKQRDGFFDINSQYSLHCSLANQLTTWNTLKKIHGWSTRNWRSKWWTSAGNTLYIIQRTCPVCMSSNNWWGILSINMKWTLISECGCYQFVSQPHVVWNGRRCRCPFFCLFIVPKCHRHQEYQHCLMWNSQGPYGSANMRGRNGN